MDSDAGRSLATRMGVGKQRHIQTRWLWLQERVRGGELQVRRVDGEQNVSDLGTKHLDARRRDYLMNLMGLKMGRRQTSSMQGVAMVACLGQAADAAGELVIVGQPTDDGILLTSIILMTLVILVMVGFHTLWRAAFPVPVVQVGRRSVGTQTGEEIPASDAPTAVPSPWLHPIDQLESYPVYQLKTMCRARGLSVAGLKRDHVLRLEQSLRLEQYGR
jgi:hypothetical protein